MPEVLDESSKICTKGHEDCHTSSIGYSSIHCHYCQTFWGSLDCNMCSCTCLDQAGEDLDNRHT
jgi:hypothetical protein